MSVPAGRPKGRDVGLRSRGGGTSYNGLYGADGEALPERGTFLRLQVNGRVGISLV